MLVTVVKAVKYVCFFFLNVGIISNLQCDCAVWNRYSLK